VGVARGVSEGSGVTTVDRIEHLRRLQAHATGESLRLLAYHLQIAAALCDAWNRGYRRCGYESGYLIGAANTWSPGCGRPAL
jgi:hypothetical protein